MGIPLLKIKEVRIMFGILLLRGWRLSLAFSKKLIESPSYRCF
jgi:hypothetical protein